MHMADSLWCTTETNTVLWSNYTPIKIFFFKKFIYLILAVLGLRFCTRAFSSRDKRGPLFIAVCGPLSSTVSRCRAQAPDAQAQQLWLTGPVAPRHVGSSQTRARTRVPCIRQADSQPLRHQGSPKDLFFLKKKEKKTPRILQKHDAKSCFL